MHASLLGRQIAQGRTADIYAWGQGSILKLFHNWVNLEDIRHEARVSRLVQASGLPVPSVGESIQVDGRNGLIYQRLDGLDMLAVLLSRPWRVAYYARRLAMLQAAMHAIGPIPGLPPQRGQLEGKLRHAKALPAHLRDAALAALVTLPDGECLCHGDLHPGNVLLTARGEVVIDWPGAARGNPLADVARSAVLLLGAAGSEQVPGVMMKAFVRLFTAIYLRHYFHLRRGGEPEYKRWLPIVAAARLSEDIPEVQAWLIGEAEKIA